MVSEHRGQKSYEMFNNVGSQGIIESSITLVDMFKPGGMYMHLIITPRTILVSLRPSVCLSVRPSSRVCSVAPTVLDGSI